MTSLTRMPGSISIHGWFKDALSKCRIDIGDLHNGYWKTRFPFNKCTDIRIERLSLDAVRSQINYYGPITYCENAHYNPVILSDISEKEQRVRYESMFSSFRFTLLATGESQLYGKTFSKILVFCGGVSGFDQDNDLLSLLKYLEIHVVPAICLSKQSIIRHRSSVPIGPYTLNARGVEFVKRGLFGSKEVTIPYHAAYVNAGSESVWISAQGYPAGPNLNMSEMNSLVIEPLINSMR